MGKGRRPWLMSSIILSFSQIFKAVGNVVTVTAYMSITHNISSSRLTTEQVKKKLVVTVTKQKCHIEPGAVPSRIA